MILIVNSEMKIKAKCSAAPGQPLDYIVAYFDGSNVNFDKGAKQGSGTISNTYTDIVPYPSHDRITRDVNHISIYNNDSVNQTITIAYETTSGTRVLFVALLLPSEKLAFEKDEGWHIYDELGRKSEAADSRILSQSAPGAVLTDIFTATGKAEIHKIIVSNRSSTAKTIRVSVAPLGAADATSQYLYYDYSISKNDTKEIPGIFYLDPTDKIRVYAQDNTVTFTISGKYI